VVATMVRGGRGSRTQAMVYTDIRFGKSATTFGVGSGNGASGSGPATARYRMTGRRNARVRIKYRLAMSLVTAICPSFLLLVLLWVLPSILLSL